MNADTERTTPATDETAERRRPFAVFRSAQERARDKAAALAEREQAMIEVQRARDQREFEALEAEREKARLRRELATQAKLQQNQAAAERRSFRQRISRAVVLASANGGVNAVAVLGQVLGLTLGMGWPWWVAVPVALVAESIAVNVGYISHDKLINGYSAGWLRTLSYAIGVAVGWFNYTENANVPLTKEYALVFGACSLLSPVLWQIYSQWRHWEELRLQGMLEARAPKFAKLRWIIPSLRGETWQAFKLAVAEGIQSPEVAIGEVRSRIVTRTARDTLYAAREELVRAQSDALRLALVQLAALAHDLDGEDPRGTEARQNIAVFLARFRPFIPAVDLSEPDADSADEPEPVEEPTEERKMPTDQDNQRAKRYVINAVKRSKTVPTKGAVASKFGFSESWGYDRVVEAKRELEDLGWTFDPKGNPVEPGGTLVGSSNGSRPNPSHP
ncbi:hypothetical protein AB0L65_33300 [Nonomuraea sp. NPDC052116]|uniref:hypothetical protein n=1 Tax=Nonomuraea sp. NPDC052116 TaxID=3155665 RepID=UPI003447A401